MVDLNKHSVDELIDVRKNARADRNYQLCDLIRNHLDSQLIFIFDGVNGQEIYYLTESFFKFKSRIEKRIGVQLNERKFLEYRIKQDINAEAFFNDWLERNKK